MRFTLLVVCFGVFTWRALAADAVFPAETKERLPNFDKRPGERMALRAVDHPQRIAVTALRDKEPRAQVELDDITGSPKWLAVSGGFLTGAEGKGALLAPATLGAFHTNDPHRVIKAFVEQHAVLFGHGAAELAQARVERDYLTEHNGLRTVAWAQSFEGIPVFDGMFIGHVTRRGELVNVSDRFVANLPDVLARSVPQRAHWLAKPPISAIAALVRAAANVGEKMDAASVITEPQAATSADQRQVFRAAALKGEARASLVWLPINRSTVRLAWQVEFTSRARGELFRSLVDLERGEVLARRCLTYYLSEATYRVFTHDSPSPFSPGYSMPTDAQPPLAARELVTLSALSTNASPNGWIDDGVNELRGNNVDAHLDRNDDDSADTPRVQGSPARVFDFALDLARAPATYGSAAVTELFYWNNWMHDRLYELGFTEAAGNFQKNNFNHGGVGSDAVQADAQDGGGFNNANFSAPRDGSPGRMQMYIFNGPTPDRDGVFDTEIVLHEYTHGLSTRLVGAGEGLFELQSEGMGEGWSDFYALALLSEPGDAGDGVYAMGGYATYQLDNLTQNYYFGIRRYPYTTDRAKNPLTFKDADARQADAHAGVPLNPIFKSGSFAEEVHNLGEIWCVTLWEARANLIKKLGYESGNQLILQLVTDGMKLAPPNPTFLQARDAIIQADLVKTGGANRDELWLAFAKRGLGFSATSPRSSSTTGVGEAFDVPDDLLVTPNAAFAASGPVGGAFDATSQVFTLANTATNIVRWSADKSAGWLDLSPAEGTLAAGSAPISVVATLNDAAPSLPAGIYTDVITFTNHVTGRAQTRAISLRVGQPDYYTKLFNEDTPDTPHFQTLTFTPDGSANFYSLCRESATVFPTDPASGTTLPFSDDAITQLTLADNAQVAFFDASYASFYVSANGYLTFTRGVSDFQKSLATHFKAPRLSMLFDDLDPSSDGQVSWLQLPDRVAITFENVPHFFGFAPNSFQAELFFDGRIRLTYLDIASEGGLIGLSRGGGVPAGFAPTKFDRYGPCLPALQMRLPISVVESAGETNGVVALPAPPADDLVVTLRSLDPAKATVPATITIPRGETNALFAIQLVADTALTGARRVAFSAAAPGFRDGRGEMQIQDDEIATLTIAVPTTATEGDGVLRRQGKISLSQAPARSVIVELISTAPDEIAVPNVVVIPAGQTSASFDLTVMDDRRIDDVTTSLITARVSGWAEATAPISVRDNEPKQLTLAVTPRAGEGNGVLRGAGTIRIPGTLTNDLIVALAASDESELTVPASVVIPRGQTNASFDLSIVDDAGIDGTQTVTISASAVAFTNAVATVIVNDNETPPAPAGPSPAQLSTNNSPNLRLSWSTGEGELIVNGDFETGDLTGWSKAGSGSGEFVVDDGTLDPGGPEDPAPPFAGKFSALSQQTGPNQSVLYQDVTISAGALAAVLTWHDRLHNHASDFTEQEQGFRVEIRSPDDKVLAVAYSTAPGDPLQTDWTARRYDLAAFIGQTVRIAFVERDNLGYFNVGLDDVSVSLGKSGETSYEVYFGTNAAPGAAELRGTTATNAWPLPRLEIERTYFWQVVALRGAARTPGPVWQFSVPGVGPLDHFAWSEIASPQFLNQPIAATLTAQDVFDNTVTNFPGPAALAARVEFPDATIGAGAAGWEFPLGGFFEDARAQVIYQAEEVGAARKITALALYVTRPRSEPAPRFTIRMKHTTLRSYPTRPAWERTGWTTVYQKSEPVAERGWQVFQLTTPFDYDGTSGLMIDFSYKGANFSDGGDCRSTQTGDQRALTYQSFGFEGDPLAWSGTTAPTPDVTNRVPNIRLSGRVEIASQPAVSGIFTNGAWRGELQLRDPVAAVSFAADDGESHTGKGNAFDVRALNDLSVTGSVPAIVTVETDFEMTFEVRNSGPATATNVVFSTVILSNLFSFVTASVSQGVFTFTNQVFTGQLGNLTANDVVTIHIQLRANNVNGGGVGVALIRRDGFGQTEAYIANDNFHYPFTLAPPPVISIAPIEIGEGDTGTTNAVFTVCLSGPSSAPVSVDYRTFDGSASNRTDYVAARGTLTFAPGQTVQTIDIPVIGDTEDETDENFSLSLSNATNATLRASGASCLIRDNDGPKISVADASVVEGNSGTTNLLFKVTLDHPSPQRVTVEYFTSSGSATAGRDFESKFDTLTFAPGTTNQTVAIKIFGDSGIEPNERFFVSLFSAENATLADRQATGTIINDDGLPGELDHFEWVDVPSPQIVNQPFAVTLLARDAANRPATNYAGPARLSAAMIRPEVAVGAGEEPWTDPLGVLFEDSRVQIIYRAAELGPARPLTALSLLVTNVPGMTLRRWTIRMKTTPLDSYGGTPNWERTGWTMVYQTNQTITTPGWVTFSFTQPFAYDGASNLLIDFSFNNSDYAFEEGECVSTLTEDTRAIWGSSDSFDGDPLNWNGRNPPPEARHQILNLRLESRTPIALAPASSGNFVDGAWSGDVTVQALAPFVALVAGDALGHSDRGNDFALTLVNDLSLAVEAAPNPVTIGDPVTFTCAVHNSGPTDSSGLVLTNALPVGASFVSASSSQGVCAFTNGVVRCDLGNLPAGSNAVVTLVLRGPSVAGAITNVTSVARNEADTYLANNTVETRVVINPTPVISSADIAVLEGTSATTNAIFSVRLSVPSSRPVSVDYLTQEFSATLGQDFLGVTGTLVFPPGTTSLPVSVPVIGDSLDEVEETFQLTLTNAVNATVSSRPAVCRIIDDDGPLISISPASVLEGDSGVKNLVFRVTLSEPSVQTIVLDFATADGTASAGEDYFSLAAKLVFLPGFTNQIISISAKGDIVIEPDETFFVELSNATNATIQVARATGTILNDDGLPGELEHFEWSAIGGAQRATRPISVVLAARDSAGQLATNFNGVANLEARAAKPEQTIGEATADWLYPLEVSFDTMRLQSIYLAKELGAARRLTALALNVTKVPPAALRRWTIRLKHTPLASYPARPQWERTGWTTVYQADETMGDSGWINFKFSTPFDFNGTNNLLIDFSFMNESSSFFADGKCASTDTTEARSLSYESFNFGLSSDDPLNWSNATAPPDARFQVPDIRLSSYAVLALSPTNAVSFTNGLWTGSLVIAQPATNVVLIAADKPGHAGASRPFDVGAWLDSDNDGLPDDWELAHGLNPQDARDAAQDPDGDGLSNTAEYLASTDPQDRTSELRLALTRAPDAAIKLSFRTAAGKLYRLESTLDVARAQWQAVAESITGDGSVLEFVVPIGNGVNAIFYRLRLLP